MACLSIPGKSTTDLMLQNFYPLGKSVALQYKGAFQRSHGLQQIIALETFQFYPLGKSIAI